MRKLPTWNWKGKSALILLVLALFAPKAENQGISPLVQVIHANKKGHADGTFQSINGTTGPLAVTLEVKALVLDSDGYAKLVDVDKSKMHITLDSTAERLAPLSSHTFSFAADCEGPCQFLIITHSGAIQKVESGVAVRVALAETIYVEQPSPMQKTDVDVSWTNAHTLVLKNTSAKMARFSPNDIHYADKKTTVPYPDFTLDPNATRVLHFDDAIPASVELHAERFEVKTTPVQ